jgi:HD-GYP domain-containing protein (c-di-GMP phosphodiesterase class II)
MPKRTNQLHNQNEEKEKRAAELVIANQELLFQNEEKEKRAAELVLANKELAFQNEEKEKRAAELVIANQELLFQNEEKEKRAAELVLANKELAFQNEEKEKRAAELAIANKELLFQNEEKEKRAAELVIANKELLFQNEEKEKRAAELVLANKELLFQNEEKEKRAAELVLANKELAFQNEEKEKRAAELVVANKELLFQNEEKEKRAAELVLANKELAFQNEEKEKRAAELIIANEETVRRLQNIQALHKIDQAIAGSLDLNLTLNVVLEQVKTQLNIDAAAVLLLNPHTQILEFTSGLGFRSKAIERSRLRLGEGHSGRAALERRMVSITDLLENSTQFDRAPLLADEGFATYFGTPLIAKGQVNGVLEIYHRLPFAPDENWLELFKILAGQAAIAVDSASLFTDLIHSNAELFAAYDSTIEGWSHALDLRDKETEGHTQRVTEITMTLARAAGITEDELVHVRRGALLHDIGKMGVPDHILLKPDKLTDEEWAAMRKHPTFAFELLSPIAYLRSALDIPYCHHEKWDGSGYPRGLKGEQIPLAARLFAIVDVWDALRSDRPYRQGWTKEKVIEHIKSLSGTHFEPKAVELFFNMMSEDEKNAG